MASSILFYFTLCNYSITIYDDQVSYMIRFPLSDFILSIGADHKSHYQRKKALQIFKDLEAFQIFKLQRFTLEDFDDFEFCSSVIMPYLKVKKNGRLWTVNLTTLSTQIPI